MRKNINLVPEFLKQQIINNFLFQFNDVAINVGKEEGGEAVCNLGYTLFASVHIIL